MPTVLVTALETGAVTGMMTDAMKTALTDAFSGISADVFEIMGVALPIGLGIAGVFIAIRLGINFFRSIAN
mgnify:CR=1 FL=1